MDVWFWWSCSVRYMFFIKLKKMSELIQYLYLIKLFILREIVEIGNSANIKYQ